MTRAIRVAAKTLAFVGALLSALAIATFAVNAIDERLTPQAEALLNPPSNPFRADDNSYLLLLGLSAARGGSLAAAGEARLAEEARLLALIVTDPTAAQNMIAQRAMSGAVDGVKVDAPEKFCEFGIERVWERFSTRRAEIRALVSANRDLLDRYAVVKRAAGFRDIAPRAISGVTPVLPSRLRCLFLADVATRIHDGLPTDRIAALAELAVDTHLWQSVLTADTDVGTTLVAANVLRSNFFLASDAAAVLPDDFGTAAGLAAAEEALGSAGAWDSSPSFAREVRGLAATLDSAYALSESVTSHPESFPLITWWDRLGGMLGAHFLKRTATLNLVAERVLHAAQLSHSVSTGAPANFRQYREWCHTSIGPTDVVFGDRSLEWLLKRARVSPLGFAYNPYGHSLVSLGVDADEQWVRDISDAMAVQRAARLSIEIRRARIAAADIDGFLPQHPEWSIHPATGTAFEWNAATGLIVVRPAGHWPDWRRFSVSVWGQTPAPQARRDARNRGNAPLASP